MKALSLFSGIGGIDLACEWAGIETVAFCEREPFCQKVLKKHWANVPIYDDVCTLTKARLEEDGIGTIDLIHGGYPCQPFSVAGKREGENDDRHLWPEVFRLIQAIQPRWFVGENVAGHVTLGLDIVLSDLESIGYAWEAFVIPASAVNARHRRDRVFIMAHAERIGLPQRKYEEQPRCEKGISSWNGETFANTTGERLEGQQRKEFEGAGIRLADCGERDGRKQWAIEPQLGRVANGIPSRVDRLKALGNAVVPQQIYPILAAIKQIDDAHMV